MRHVKLTMAPRFSVVTISFNHAEFIEDTIRSVLAQNTPDVQHIVIDGGSTDGTLEILARYPHLEWISEPDRGISHALNKGFARCKGQILSWLNADDFYAPGCFAAVAKAAGKSALIMGDAIEADRAGKPIRIIQNLPRGYYDVARYWVPKAWLAQPSVFFTRELLEKSRLPNGDYFDESFRYSMDAELWLRLGEHAHFDCRISEVLSSFRVYGENKTGRTFAAPRKELGRAFRKACARKVQFEVPTALVLPLDTITTDLTSTLASLLDQTQKDFDLLLVDFSNDAILSKSIREMVLEMEEHAPFGVKYLKALKPNVLSAWNTGLAESRALVTGFVAPGTKFDTDAVSMLQNVFSHDLNGACLPLKNFTAIQKTLVDHKTGSLNTAALLAARDIFSVFFARTVAVREVGGFSEQQAQACAVKALFLSLLARGWGLSAVNQVGIVAESLVREIKEGVSAALLPYEQAALIVNVNEESSHDIFYPVRTASGVVRGFAETDIETAKLFLKQAPKDFMTLNWLTNPVTATQTHPQFAPGWLALAAKLLNEGKLAEANVARSRFEQLKIA